MRNLTHRWHKFNPVRTFFPKSGHFYLSFKKVQGRPAPLPPSSYVPDMCSWNESSEYNNWITELNKTNILSNIFQNQRITYPHYSSMKCHLLYSICIWFLQSEVECCLFCFSAFRGIFSTTWIWFYIIIQK